MEISVQPNDLIEALSKRLSETLIELETTRLALKQAQEGILVLEAQITSRTEDASLLRLPFSEDYPEP
jgi:hypothetical protein